MEIVEDFEHFRCILPVKSITNIEKAFTSIEEISNLFSEEILEYLVLNHDETISDTLDNINDLREKLLEVINDKDDHDDFGLKVSCYKNNTNRLAVYSPQKLLQSISGNFESSLRNWNRHIGASKKIKTLKNTYPLRDFSFDSDISKYSLPDVLKNTTLLPESIFSLVRIADEFGQYFSVLCAKFCLQALASSIKSEEESRSVYSFEGYAKVTLETQKDEEYIDRLETIYEVYRWVFIDNNYNTRLGILRNVMSIKNNNSFVGLFDDDLLRILQSNYKIYLKDNIKQYIEVKNKTSEFMFELQKKSIDIFEDYKNTFQKVILAVISFFFTFVMVKIFNKSNTILFTTEVVLLTSTLLIFSIAYITFSWKDLDARKQQLLGRLLDIKKQYKNVVDEKELEEIFDTKLIEKIDTDVSLIFKAVFWIIILSVLLCGIISIGVLNQYKLLSI